MAEVGVRGGRPTRVAKCGAASVPRVHGRPEFHARSAGLELAREPRQPASRSALGNHDFPRPHQRASRRLTRHAHPPLPPAKLAFVLLTVAGASIAAADVERPVSARRVVPTTPLGGSRSPLSPRCGPDSDDVPLTNATGAISDGSGPGLYLPHTDCTWIVRPSTLAPPPTPTARLRPSLLSPRRRRHNPRLRALRHRLRRRLPVRHRPRRLRSRPRPSPRARPVHRRSPRPLRRSFRRRRRAHPPFRRRRQPRRGFSRSSTSPTARATTTAPREVDASAASARVTTDGSDRTAPYRFRPSSATARRPEASSASERRDIFASSRRRSRRISCSSSR